MHTCHALESLERGEQLCTFVVCGGLRRLTGLVTWRRVVDAKGWILLADDAGFQPSFGRAGWILLM